MDSGKLYRILEDILIDEQTFNIGGQIENIRNDFSQNTPESFASANEKITSLFTEIESKSVVYTYSPSENLFLEYLNGQDYFGRGLITKLNTIFKGRGYEIVTKMDEFKTRRIDFIAKSQKLADSYGEMKLAPWRPDKYEVGLILPPGQETVDNITKVLKEFEFLLSGITEGVRGEHENVQINRLSNGSIAFFSPQDVDVAVKVADFLANILQIWVCVEAINNRIKNNEADKLLGVEAKEGMKAVLEEEAQRIREKIIKELPETVLQKLTKGRDNEVRHKIKIGITAVFNWIQIGIKIDVTPIRTEKTEEGQSDPKEQRITSSLKKTNAELQKLYSLPIEQKRLPFSLSEEQPIESVNEQKPQEKAVRKKKHTGRQ